jgi:eukaryotic-like serine/threonine-protein kinase
MARTLAGRYELEVPLGRGASGRVWRGRDLSTREPVAVKLVELGEIGHSAVLAEMVARFRREVATLARLRHPNIVAALEAGRTGNELFLVMELAEGISLASMLEQRMANNIGLLPVASLLLIAEQTCAGLAAAHSAGVVHRDIKPSNLMVATRLSTKIIDFGIARLLQDSATRLTLPQQAVGTLAYIPPEQVENNDVDGRADLYSLGCVLYEQLAGRPPFLAEVPSALLHMHLKQRAVPLDSIRSDLPVGLARLVDRLMEKDRSARPADATQVLAYIAAIRAGTDRSRPAQEADRQTVNRISPLGAVPAGEKLVPEQGRVRPEAGRKTVDAREILPRSATPASKADRSPSVAPGHRAQPSFVPHEATTQRTDAASRDDPEPPGQPPAPGHPEAATPEEGSWSHRTETRLPAFGRTGGSPHWPDPPTTGSRRWRPGWRGLFPRLMSAITSRRRGDRNY